MPSWARRDRSATTAGVKVWALADVTMSGSVASTVSSDGSLSASRGIFALSPAKAGRTGSNQVEVPTMRSARPSDSKISVEA